MKLAANMELFNFSIQPYFSLFFLFNSLSLVNSDCNLDKKTYPFIGFDRGQKHYVCLSLFKSTSTYLLKCMST